MPRAAALLALLTALALAGPGCAIFGKREGSSERSGPFSWFKKKDAGNSGPPPAKFPGGDPLVPGGTPPPVPPTPTAQAPNPADISLLAGRVVDPYNRPATHTYIRLVALDGAKEGSQQFDVVTTDDGYFTIPNLKAGAQYRLIARTRQGDKMLAGITQTQAPNPRVVIQVDERFATSDIPPLPAAAAPPVKDPERKDKSAALPAPAPQAPLAATWAPAPPGQSPAPAPPIDLSASVPVPVSTPAAPEKAWPPALQIAPKKPAVVAPSPKPFVPPPPSLPSLDPQAGLAPKVPSCVVLAKSIQVLALNDLDGRPWNFHPDHKGRLILFDFWRTNCPPCQKGMAELTRVQNKFGPKGLEVVGVFIDRGTLADQSRRAKDMCHRLSTNYRQLLGQDDRTDVCRQFGVELYPTMVLVDDTGRELWRHVGVPEPGVIENVIEKQLANRPY